MKHILIFTTLTFMSSLAYSENLTCVNLFTRYQEVSPGVLSNTLSSAINLRDMPVIERQQAHHIEIWNNLVGDYFVPRLKFKLTAKSILKSNYNPLRRLLTLGVFLEGRPEKAREIFAAHEFGHAIFDEHFSFFYKGFKVSLKQMVADLSPHHPDIFERFSNLFKKRNPMAKEISDPFRRLNHVQDMLMAYDELFADTLPVLLRHDPNAIADVILSPNEFATTLRTLKRRYRQNNPDAPPIRSFTLTDFKNWQHEQQDQYTLFDPVRGVLWKLYMENLKPEEIPLFIKTFLEAASQHVSKRLSLGEDTRVSSQTSDPEKINHDFLIIFMKVAREFGLPMSRAN